MLDEDKEAQVLVIEPGEVSSAVVAEKPRRLEAILRVAGDFKRAAGDLPARLSALFPHNQDLSARLSDLFPHNQDDEDDEDDNNDYEEYEGIFFKETRNEDREEQRQKAMKHICGELFSDVGDKCKFHPPGERFGLKSDEVGPTIIEVANMLFADKNYSFQRFERLAVCDTLYWQHKLVVFDEKFRDRKKRKEEPTESTNKEINAAWNGDEGGHSLSFCLTQYCRCFENVQWTYGLKAIRQEPRKPPLRSW